MDYVIDKEIESLLTPSTKEEFEQLEENIVKWRHVDPVVIAILDGQRVLADGHNRRKVCVKHKIPMPEREQVFSSREDLIQWVIDNQLGRRNLTDARRAYYRGKEYLNKKKSVGNPKQLGQNVPVEDQGETDEVLGEKHGVSGKTIQRDADFAEAVEKLEEPVKQAILDEKISPTKQQVINGQPILCPKCARNLRVGKEVVKGCPECKELRKGEPKSFSERHNKRRPAPSTKSEPKMHQATFDFDAYDNHLAELTALPREVAAAFDGEKKSDEYKESVRLIDELSKVWKKRQKRLQKGK